MQGLSVSINDSCAKTSSQVSYCYLRLRCFQTRKLKLQLPSLWWPCFLEEKELLWIFLLGFLSQGTVLQLSRAAESLQKVRIVEMTFEWRDGENQLHMEHMGNSLAQWSQKLGLYTNWHLCKLLSDLLLPSPEHIDSTCYFSLMLAKALVLPITWDSLYLEGKRCFVSAPSQILFPNSHLPVGA